LPSTPSSTDDTPRRPSRRAIAILVAVSILVPGVLLAIVLAGGRNGSSEPDQVAATCKHPLSDDAGTLTTLSDVPATAPTLSTPSRAGVGEPAPDFSLVTLDRCERVQLSALRGKPVVVTFFASWCHPCEEEMPLLQAAHEASDAFNVVAVTYDDLRPDSVQFVKRLGVTYPSVFDTGGAVADRYGVHGIPQTWFIDDRGVVRERVFGITTRGALDTPLQKLLAASTN